MTKKKTKSDPFSFRLKHRLVRFRLPLNNPKLLDLWSQYLEREKGVKPAFFEIATLAREQLNESRHNQTFILNMIYKHKEKVQTAVDEIFRLALERYHSLQKEGHGQVPVLSDKENSILTKYEEYRKKWKKEERP